MKTRHKDKLKLARRFRHEEAMRHDIGIRKLVMRTSVFDTDSWKRKKKQIEKRVDQTIANQQMMKAKKEYQNGINKPSLGSI